MSAPPPDAPPDDGAARRGDADDGRSRRGRCLDLRDGTLVLLDAGRITRVREVPDGACAPGDLVRVDLGREADDPARVEVVWRPRTEAWAASDADLGRLTPARWERLRARARLLAETRRFFSETLGFLEVETPQLIVAPAVETHIECVRAQLSATPGAPAEPRWLIPSPELAMKRLLAAGAPPIFEIARVFRDGERGRNHRPEFTMIEWYRPWEGYEALMVDCERWLTALAGGTTLTYQGRAYDLTPPWPRVPFLRALEERAGIVDPARLSPDAQLEALVAEVEPTLGQDGPELLIEWPVAMASLARPKPGDARVAERFELYLAGLELANAFGELTDPDEQRARFVADNAERVSLGLPAYPLDAAFFAALEAGMPPSAGIAVGLDRVVMLLTDAPSIDDVLAF